MATKKQGLRYVGDGRWLPGVPARDLDERDLERVTQKRTVEELIASGLYVEAKSEE